jgi:hypothetical protein
MEDQLKQRNWFTKKLFDAVLVKSKKKKLAMRNEQSRVTVAERSQAETEKLAESIKDQN